MMSVSIASPFFDVLTTLFISTGTDSIPLLFAIYISTA